MISYKNEDIIQLSGKRYNFSKELKVYSNGLLVVEL